MILKHLTDALILVLWMGVITLAFKGWGGVVRRWLSQSGSVKESIGVNAIPDIWIGLCICISFAELIHFALPINWQVSVAVLGLGIFLELHHYRYNYLKAISAARLNASISAQTRLHLTAFCAISFIWISAAMLTPNNYDSGLYHFSSIKWLNEHPLILGLVNLHSRLAFNQSYFALIALLNFHPFYPQAYAGTGVYLLILTALSCAHFIGASTPHRIFLFVCLLILLNGFVLKASSPTPDLAVALFQIVIFLVLFNILRSDGRAPPCVNERRVQDTSAPLLILLCASSVTIKLSMVMFCFGAALMMYRPIIEWAKGQRLYGLRLIVICATILCIHAIRGIGLSGMPFYPSTLGALWNLPYAPDISVPINEANWVYSWARQPGLSPELVLGNWAWLTPWVAAQPIRFWILSISALALLAINLMLLLDNRVARNHVRMYALYTPLVLGVGFWFFTAPEPRFLGAILELSVALGAWLLCLSLSQHMALLWRYLRIPILLAVIAFGALALAYLFKLQTGLGLAQYFYISELLLALSRINLSELLLALSRINLHVSFYLALTAGLVLLLVRKLVFRKIPSGNRRSKLTLWTQNTVTALFLYSSTLYFADAIELDSSKLMGWPQVPTEPHKTVELRSKLILNTPINTDQCWAANLPCVPQAYINENLRLQQLSLNKLLPPVSIFITK